MAERKTFRLEVISPERIFYTGDAEMVELTTTESMRITFRLRRLLRRV